MIYNKGSVHLSHKNIFYHLSPVLSSLAHSFGVIWFLSLHVIFSALKQHILNPVQHRCGWEHTCSRGWYLKTLAHKSETYLSFVFTVCEKMNFADWTEPAPSHFLSTKNFISLFFVCVFFVFRHRKHSNKRSFWKSSWKKPYRRYVAKNCSFYLYLQHKQNFFTLISSNTAAVKTLVYQALVFCCCCCFVLFS